MKYIKCPYCGYEYHPSEIFVPKYYFGMPKDIVRDENNKIIECIGTDPDPNESFTCHNCDNTFMVTGEITFYSKKSPFKNFSENFSVKRP